MKKLLLITLLLFSNLVSAAYPPFPFYCTALKGIPNTFNVTESKLYLPLVLLQNDQVIKSVSIKFLDGEHFQLNLNDPAKDVPRSQLTSCINFIASFYNTNTKTLYLDNVFVGSLLLKKQSAIIDLQSGTYKILN